MGQRTNLGETGGDIPARARRTTGQSPTLETASHAPCPGPLPSAHGRARVPGSRGPRRVSQPCLRGARRGAVRRRRRHLPARSGCAGSSRRCSARRGRPGARGAAARPPAPNPRSTRRRPAARPARTARAGPASPPPAPAPWPARPAPSAPRSRLGSAARRGRGAGERPSKRRGGGAGERQRGRPARPGGRGRGGGCPAATTRARPSRRGSVGLRARDALLRPPHPATVCTFFCTFSPRRPAPSWYRLCVDSGSPRFRLLAP